MMESSVSPSTRPGVQAGKHSCAFSESAHQSGGDGVELAYMPESELPQRRSLRRGVRAGGPTRCSLSARSSPVDFSCCVIRGHRTVKRPEGFGASIYWVNPTTELVASFRCGYTIALGSSEKSNDVF